VKPYWVRWLIFQARRACHRIILCRWLPPRWEAMGAETIEDDAILSERCRWCGWNVVRVFEDANAG
jgi:hypothetical protein